MKTMSKIETSIIKQLFNLGHLTLNDATWLQLRGYELTISNGMISNIEHVENDV